MNSTMRVVFIVALAVVVLLSLSVLAFGKGGGSGSAAGATYEQYIGAQAYATYCAGCHGADAKKGSLAPSHLAGQNADKIAKKTRSGKGNMPAFGPNVIDDATLKALASYVSGLRR